jgi:hypothetical protein
VEEVRLIIITIACHAVEDLGFIFEGQEEV